ncbi:hypothetical protein AGOR_G00061690 [Albula goreensis]|uniref:Uncharacterized protein n=1 Tax=Albula goreensis TaxID=1534307 RepID=A0A8T3DPQ8_9TELE|nr:hypothetical protein AGOR_G00061690 [Albula goreensis]
MLGSQRNGLVLLLSDSGCFSLGLSLTCLNPAALAPDLTRSERKPVTSRSGSYLILSGRPRGGRTFGRDTTRFPHAS